jgi:hypothetical protein
MSGVNPFSRDYVPQLRTKDFRVYKGPRTATHQLVLNKWASSNINTEVVKHSDKTHMLRKGTI